MFKVGDKVIRVAASDYIRNIQGRIATVKEIVGDRAVVVVFDDPAHQREWLTYHTPITNSPFEYYKPYKPEPTKFQVTFTYDTVDEAIAAAEKAAPFLDHPAEILHV